MAKFGLTGKEKAKRQYSYEFGNNPKGLFVSVDFNIVKQNFAHGGVIVEFATKVSKLEAPVWVGGRSYFVQGEYTKSFKDDEEREQQQLQNREKHKQSKYSAIANSDRPELAWALYDGPEKQALFVGDLNPNMIRAFWVNEKLRKERLTNGKWERLSRDEFLKRYDKDEFLKFKQAVHRPGKETEYQDMYTDSYYDKKHKLFMPAENFSEEELRKRLKKEDWDYDEFLQAYILNWDNGVMHASFYPKQIQQIKQYYNINTV